MALQDAGADDATISDVMTARGWSPLLPVVLRAICGKLEEVGDA
jgi:hypothetical protein